jgi:WD40 repeat protein
MLVAGEKSGPTIAAWSTATSEIAWSKALVERATEHLYTQNVHVAIHGEHVAAAVRDRLFVLELATGRVLAEHALGPGVTPFAKMIGASSSFVRFTPDGTSVLVGQLPLVRVLNWRTGMQRAEIGRCSGTHDALLAPDRASIALPGHALMFCDARTFEVVRTIELEHSACASAFSPDGRRLALADSRGAVALCDVESGAIVPCLPSVSDVREVGVQALAWSPDGERIATASEDGWVRIWHVGTREVLVELPGHDTTIPGTGARSLHGLVFAPDGRELFVGGAPVGTHAVSAYALG